MTSTDSQAFFVAPNGRDSWSGRLAAPNADGTDGPFATVERARNAMRVSPVKTTYLRGGTYRLSQTLSLTGADSGTSLLAYPGETPVLSGGQPVGGFTAFGSGLYAAPVATPTDLDLVIGGVRQTVAQSGQRVPGDVRSGWFVLDQPASGASRRALVYRPEDAIPAVLQAGTRLQAFDIERLSDTIVTVASVDPASRTITFTQDIRYPLRSGGTFRLLNDDAFLRNAGEFAWRAEDGRLVVKPQDPAVLLSQGAVVPRLDTLLRMDGASGVTVQGLTFADGRWDGVAVDVRNGSGNRFAGNRFTAVGTGLRLTGAPGSTVENNRFDQLGASGLQVTYGSHASRIAGNTVTDIGMVIKDVAAVSLYGVNDTLVTGNDIRNSPRYGISLKNWDAATINIGNRIEYNRIVNTALETGDGAGIEMLGRSDIDTRTVILGNRIETVGGLATNEAGNWLNRHKSFGIYLDDQANGVTVRDNFIRDTGWASIFIHGGDDNLVENNLAVIANPRERFIRLEWTPKAGDAGLLRNNRVTRNAVAASNGQDYWEFWSPGSYTVDGNLIQGTRRLSGGDVTSGGIFVDPAAGDYRLAPGAAAAMGIHDLDWTRMGWSQTTVPPIPTPIPTPTPTPTPDPGPGPTPVPASAPFDPLAYIASYPDLTAAFGIDAQAGTAHYLTAGQREGRSVSFEPLAYTASYADLTAAFRTDARAAAIHYITAGRREGRSVTFDPLAYTATYADLTAVFGTDAQSAAAHYIAMGRQEGRGVGFDPLAYTASYADLAAAFGTDAKAAATHYITTGRREGRGVSFNPLAYEAANPDVAAAFGLDLRRASLHYLTNGIREGRATGFDAAAYLAANEDLRRAYGSDVTLAMQHYVLIGRTEGRALAPPASRQGLGQGTGLGLPDGAGNGLLASAG